MTEDDTFLLLKKPDFESMRRIYVHWWKSLPSNNRNTMLRIRFMREHGWTWYNFIIEAKNRDVGISLYTV